MKLLAPFLSTLSALQNASEEMAPTIIANDIQRVPQENLEQLILVVLSHVRKNTASSNKEKPNFVALVTNNILNYDDLPIEEVIKIIYQAIKSQMQGFFSKNSTLAKSLMSGVEKSNSTN